MWRQGTSGRAFENAADTQPSKRTIQATLITCAPNTRGNSHDGAFGGSVAPWFVVRREDAEMTASDELVVIDAKERIRGVEKLGMKQHLHAILWRWWWK